MKHFTIIICSVFLIILNSCSVTIDTTEFIKNNQRLILKFNSDGYFLKKDSTDLTIDNNSIKYEQLKKWFIDNSDNWQSSPASYAPSDMIIIGKDFRFLIFKDFVVVAFVDKEGKSRQYTKSASISNFDFLKTKGK